MIPYWWAVVEMKRVFHFHGRSRPEYEVEKCVQLLKSGTVTNPPNESLFSHFQSILEDPGPVFARDMYSQTCGVFAIKNEVVAV